MRCGPGGHTLATWSIPEHLQGEHGWLMGATANHMVMKLHRHAQALSAPKRSAVSIRRRAQPAWRLPWPKEVSHHRLGRLSAAPTHGPGRTEQGEQAPAIALTPSHIDWIDGGPLPLRFRFHLGPAPVSGAVGSPMRLRRSARDIMLQRWWPSISIQMLSAWSQRALRSDGSVTRKCLVTHAPSWPAFLSRSRGRPERAAFQWRRRADCARAR
jgi:hypothetical protein